MPAHIRSQIRGALKNALTGLTETQSNVFIDRGQKLDDSDLPAILIETNAEVIDSANVTNTLERELDVVLRILAKPNTGIDDYLDDISKEVEETLYANLNANTLNGLVENLSLVGINVDFAALNETPVGQLIMNWRASYLNHAGIPDVVIS